MAAVVFGAVVKLWADKRDGSVEVAAGLEVLGGDGLHDTKKAVIVGHQKEWKVFSFKAGEDSGAEVRCER